MMIIKKDGTIETVDYLDSLFRDEKIYEDHGRNSRVLSVEVKNGKVWMNEGDSGPACGMMNGGLPRGVSLGVKHGEAVEGCGAVLATMTEKQGLFGVVDQVEKHVVGAESFVR